MQARQSYHEENSADCGDIPSPFAALQGRAYKTIEPGFRLRKRVNYKMAIMDIRLYPDPVLKQVAEPVAEINEELKTLARDMAETMYAAPGVGLAAPQVGVSIRLVVLDCAPHEGPRRLITAINPQIVSREGESYEEEGCLSVPGFFAPVHRAAEVLVRYQDLEGKVVELEAEGLLAVAFQHEIDHLDGVLFVDHLSSLKKGMFRKKYEKFREQQEHQL
jgi:peptide deformylase